jgi:hypothetical protein
LAWLIWLGSMGLAQGQWQGTNPIYTYGSVGIGTANPASSRLFISTDDDSVTPALSIRQSNNNNFGFDFSLDLGINGNLFLKSIQNGSPTTLASFSRNTNYLGIGVDDPAERLHVNGNIWLEGQIGYGLSQFGVNTFPFDNKQVGHYSLGWHNDSQTGGKTAYLSGYPGIRFFTNGAQRMFIDLYGNVRIDQGIKAKSLKITQNPWADFVFEPDYNLKPIEEVEAYIQTEKHLPDVPSEATIQDQGLDVGDMQKIQMQKIEELYLYIIEQQKQIKNLEDKVQILSNQLNNK